MASKKRVRIFAGPNGSGKSSLFRGFQQEIKEKTGFFVNADEIELKLNQSSLIDLQLLGLSATQSTLDAFIKTSDSQSLIAKAKGEGHTIDLQIKENCLIDNSSRYCLIRSFCHSNSGSISCSPVK